MTGPHNSDSKDKLQDSRLWTSRGLHQHFQGAGGKFYLIKRQEIAVSVDPQWTMRDRVIQCPRIAKPTIAEPLWSCEQTQEGL
jgi:hypothetical protein